MKKLMSFFKEEKGAGMVEYGLLVALIGVLLVASITLLKDALAALYGRKHQREHDGVCGLYHFPVRQDDRYRGGDRRPYQQG